MGRRRTHASLNVFLNGRRAGTLQKGSDGAVTFLYDEDWLAWTHAFPISLSLPLRREAWRGDPVVAVFDNMLPDNADVRRQVAEKTGATGVDSYSLLEQIGRDCVGAMQFLPEDEVPGDLTKIEGVPLEEADIAFMLANLARAPLGIDLEKDFRISIAGAQEKTALLRHEGRWMRPIGATPTTHILKPQLGEIPTASGVIDLGNSVENEHYCLTMLEECGLQVARTEIAEFNGRRVLVVERFDRRRRRDEGLLRLPQEDFCQALSVPSTRKYQDRQGPSAVDIMGLLKESDAPLVDLAAFLKSQILFWLIGATDGHAKNFSLYLRPGGRFELAPFYDVLTAQPAFDAKRIPHKAYRLAMSAGRSRHYRILDVHGRHFVETGLEAGIGPTIIRKVLDEVREDVPAALDRAKARMPVGFHDEIHESVARAAAMRLPRLESAYPLL